MEHKDFTVFDVCVKCPDHESHGKDFVICTKEGNRRHTHRMPSNWLEGVENGTSVVLCRKEVTNGSK